MNKKLCECGCGKLVSNFNNTFIHGHNRKGISHNKETKKKMSLAQSGEKAPFYGKKLSNETRMKLSKSKVGNKNPFYGKIHSELSKEKIRKLNIGRKLSKETKKKMSLSRSGEKAPNYGKKFSDETKRKIRQAKLKRIRESLEDGVQLTPFYNIDGCKIIDEYGKKYGYNFQHAKKGGEFYIKNLGYFVDGYDKERNTVIEIDEKHHFDIDGNLKEKDVRRQKEIEEHLGCTFIRINYEEYKSVHK